MNKNICIVDTLYSLFLYLIISKNDKETLYFLGDNIPISVSEKLKNKIYLRELKSKKKLPFKYFDIRNRNKKLIALIKNYKKVYLQDHINYSQFFLNNFQGEKILLEDGLGNYDTEFLEEERKKVKKWNMIKKIKKKYIYFEEKYYPIWGTSDKIDQILLTNLCTIPELIKEKVRTINLEKSWQELPKINKEEIIRIFDFDLNELFELNKLKNSILLLTQCYSEDNFFSENDKINLYKMIMKNEKSEVLIIKPHPREITNYNKVFETDYKKIIVLDKDFPAEIIMLLGIKVDKIITIDSSVIFNFKNKYKTQIYGTKYFKEYIERIKRKNLIK